MIPQLTFRLWLKWKWSELWRNMLRRPLCCLGWHRWLFSEYEDDKGNICLTCGKLVGHTRQSWFDWWTGGAER